MRRVLGYLGSMPLPPAETTTRPKSTTISIVHNEETLPRQARERAIKTGIKAKSANHKRKMLFQIDFVFVSHLPKTDSHQHNPTSKKVLSDLLLKGGCPKAENNVWRILLC